MKTLSTMRDTPRRTFSPITTRRLERRLEAEHQAATRRAAALRTGATAALDDIDISDLLDDAGHDGLVAGIEHEGLLRLAEDADRTAARARMAIDRLRDRTYGVCSVCGRHIPLARLEVLPTTDLCVTCSARAGRLLSRGAA